MKTEKCYNCKRETGQWITIVDGTEILTEYEDCRSPDRVICFSCFKENLEKASVGIDGNVCDAVFYRDVMFKFYPNKWR